MKPFKNLWPCRVALLALAVLGGLSIAFAPVRAAGVAAPGAPADSSLCRPMRVYNLKGAKSYLVPKGMKLLRCAGANGKRAKGTPYCDADMACANEPRCVLKMTCATDA